MDFDKIKLIRTYVKKIIRFRKLEEYSIMSNDEFHNKMVTIFPKFNKEYSKVFETVTHDEDLSFLNLMFMKLQDIETEYSNRCEEIINLIPIVKEIRALLSMKSGITKDDLVKYLENNNSEFIVKYPVIIDRLLDNEYNKLDGPDLLLEQIKYNHEIVIGNELAKKYIYPKINK